MVPATESDRAFIYMMDRLAQELNMQRIHLPTDNLTIVDVGAGPMIYGLALEEWAQQQAKFVRIIAVDPEYALPERMGLFFPSQASQGASRIEQLASRVEDALPKLKETGVEKIGLITLFNPCPKGSLPGIRRLEELCKGVPVAGAVDSNRDLSIDYVLNGLSREGYKVKMFPNTAAESLSPSYIYEFNPLFVAVQR